MKYKTKCCLYSQFSFYDSYCNGVLTVKARIIPFSDYLFRYDPVPRVQRNSHFKYLRHMKTTQERRTNQIDYSDYEEEFNIKIKYRKRELPHVYDDYFRDYHSKGWKDCSKRLTQYKSR